MAKEFKTNKPSLKKSGLKQNDFCNNTYNSKIKTLPKRYWSPGLCEIPQKPHKLYINGLENFKKLRSNNYKFLCVVGSRNYTEYAERSCQKIINEIKNYPICIVSGLAYGIDSVAHRSALENNIPTIAFPGSGLDWNTIYPAGHIDLANEIIKKGSLISEFAPNFRSMPWMFPQRNRLMAGIAEAVLIIEAGEKSGTLITANLAVEYNKTLMVVPGSIYNENSRVPNKFIQQGAELIQNGEDVLNLLGFDLKNKNSNESEFQNLRHLSEKEKKIMISFRCHRNIDKIIKETGLSISYVNSVISRLELEGLV